MAYEDRVHTRLWSKAILWLRRRGTNLKKSNVPKPKDGRRFRLLCGRGVERRTHKLVGEENGISSNVLVVFLLFVLCNGCSSGHWHIGISG